jgi:hypothetical protein
MARRKRFWLLIGAFAGAGVLAASTVAFFLRDKGEGEKTTAQGTYQGIEHYALNTGRCAYLDHNLDSTFNLVHGPKWQYHSDYCGILNGDRWTGAGTFVITVPGGATLLGTFRDSARLPSAGEPFKLTITAGSDQFRGASGSCILDNHLRQIEFGLQEQFGTFVCDIDH